MKHCFLAIAAVVLLYASAGYAQTSADDASATKADVERYFQLVKSHDLMKKLMATMSQNQRQLMHEQYLKHKDELPEDYESQMETLMANLWAKMPLDEMMQAMMPAYQKHFTHGDIENLIAFYSTPTGAKLLNEMPSIMAEAMQDMMPVISRYVDTMQQTLKEKTDEMIAQSKKRSDTKAPTANN